MAAPTTDDMETDAGTESFPSELQDRLTAFDDSLSKMEEIFNVLHGKPLNELHTDMSSLDKAKLDLLGVYAINSLFWMYLNTKGENPKEHGVKLELDRIRSYMGRVKEIQDKAQAPKLNKEASKKFVRNALWQAAHKDSAKRPPSQESPETVTPAKTKKMHKTSGKSS